MGDAEAIREMARARVMWPLGVLLVLLTAFPRNYDQTFFTEKPFLWLFGPLLFSFVSGTVLFLALGGLFRRWRPDLKIYPESIEPIVPFWVQWRSFMGLFWLTAPIAWLYAIPVERFLGSLDATRANLFLLGVVSFWRVVLMARVVSVTSRDSFFKSLIWVLCPATAEVLVVYIFGDHFSKTLMAGMGGMRNSPEEEVLLGAMNLVAGLAIWVFPITLVVGLWVRAGNGLGMAQSDGVLGSERLPVRTPWRALSGILAVWLLLTVPAQRQLYRNVIVERFVASGAAREALDFLGSHQPGDFAPSRPLPPKAFESTVFQELPALFGVVQTNEPIWIQEHLMTRLNEMSLNFLRRWERSHWDTGSVADRREILARSHFVSSMGGEGWSNLLVGLRRVPMGNAWLATNELILDAVTDVAAEAPSRSGDRSTDTLIRKQAWTNLAVFLEREFGKRPLGKNDVR